MWSAPRLRRGRHARRRNDGRCRGRSPRPSPRTPPTLQLLRAKDPLVRSICVRKPAGFAAQHPHDDGLPAQQAPAGAASARAAPPARQWCLETPSLCRRHRTADQGRREFLGTAVGKMRSSESPAARSECVYSLVGGERVGVLLRHGLEPKGHVDAGRLVDGEFRAEIDLLDEGAVLLRVADDENFFHDVPHRVGRE